MKEKISRYLTYLTQDNTSTTIELEERRSREHILMQLVTGAMSEKEAQVLCQQWRELLPKHKESFRVVQSKRVPGSYRVLIMNLKEVCTALERKVQPIEKSISFLTDFFNLINLEQIEFGYEDGSLVTHPMALNDTDALLNKWKIYLPTSIHDDFSVITSRSEPELYQISISNINVTSATLIKRYPYIVKITKQLNTLCHGNLIEPIDFIYVKKSLLTKPLTKLQAYMLCEQWKTFLSLYADSISVISSRQDPNLYQVKIENLVAGQALIISEELDTVLLNNQRAAHFLTELFSIGDTSAVRFEASGSQLVTNPISESLAQQLYEKWSMFFISEAVQRNIIIKVSDRKQGLCQIVINNLQETYLAFLKQFAKEFERECQPPIDYTNWSATLENGISFFVDISYYFLPPEKQEHNDSNIAAMNQWELTLEESFNIQVTQHHSRGYTRYEIYNISGHHYHKMISAKHSKDLKRMITAMASLMSENPGGVENAYVLGQLNDLLEQAEDHLSQFASFPELYDPAVIQALNSQIVLLFLNQDDEKSAFHHFEANPDLDEKAIFSLCSSSFSTKHLEQTEKHRRVLTLFSSYEHYPSIKLMLMQSALYLLSGKDVKYGDSLADYGIDKCVPIAVIKAQILTVIHSLGDEPILQDRLILILNYFDRFNPKQLLNLLNIPQIKQVLEDNPEIGTSRLISYSAVLALKTPLKEPLSPQSISPINFIDSLLKKFRSDQLPRLSFGLFADARADFLEHQTRLPRPNMPQPKSGTDA